MEPIDIYTSTGVKFWYHPKQMLSYLHGTGKTIVSTHISPEGKCNLACSYCSVSRRNSHDRIQIDVIDKYISDLKSRGLKAVILTGGGEPTIYPYWNELMGLVKKWYLGGGIKFGLITNGVDLEYRGPLNYFEWIRISINHFPGMEVRIGLDPLQINDKCTVGMSMVFDDKNKALPQALVSHMADKVKAQYVRILPNCLPEELDDAHKEIDEWMHSPDINHTDKRFFHQYKIHKAPSVHFCPQAYFRPYLSEADGGTVFPCDSVVLNDKMAHFNSKWAICKASEILDFMDGKIKQKFNPEHDCKGCVFQSNIEMLRRWGQGEHQFHVTRKPIDHVDFI